MRKITAIGLTLVLLLSLCACGGASSENASVLGTYTLYAMDYDENTIILASELFEGESYVTLKSGGMAEMCMEGDRATVTWKLNGEELLIHAADGDTEGSLKDGILTLVFDGSNLYYLADGANKNAIRALTLEELLYGQIDQLDIPETDAPATSATDVQKLWNGWYYGCLDLSGCEGGWEPVNGLTFDAAMQVELDADGNGTLIIYDPYGEFVVNPQHNNRYVVINCHADTSYLYGDSGTSFDRDINTADWRVVRNMDNPDKLGVGSSYTDEAGNKLGYDFTFLPWGDRWEKETYQKFIPHFDEYLAKLDEGWTDPFGGTAALEAPANPAGAPSEGRSELLGGNPARLDVNDRGIVAIYYPADQFTYDDWYGKLKNEGSGVGILLDPMLGATNFDELKASYAENNSDEDEYSLVETTVNGYKALILKYSDWLGATMRVDIDFGGNHDGWYGISFAVSGDSLSDCDTELIWAIIDSMELMK